MTTAIILAGGFGTRLKSVVADVPKPMAPINGQPFLALLMDYWIGQGVTRFILSTGYKHEVISTHFGQAHRNVPIEYVVEDAPLGTGGGVLLAAAKLEKDAPFLLLNGDTYFAVDLVTLTHFQRTNDADWTFSLFRTSDTVRYLGMDIADNGRITALKSSAEHTSRLANGGVYLVHPRALSSAPAAGNACSLENDVFPTALRSGQRFFGLEFDRPFIDIGVPEDYRRAGTIIQG